MTNTNPSTGKQGQGQRSSNAPRSPGEQSPRKGGARQRDEFGRTDHHPKKDASPQKDKAQNAAPSTADQKPDPDKPGALVTPDQEAG